MKAENGLGGIVKLAGKRRKPYMIRNTKGYIINGVTGKKEQVFKVIGYAATIKEAKKILIAVLFKGQKSILFKRKVSNSLREIRLSAAVNAYYLREKKQENSSC